MSRGFNPRMEQNDPTDPDQWSPPRRRRHRGGKAACRRAANDRHPWAWLLPRLPPLTHDRPRLALTTGTKSLTAPLTGSTTPSGYLSSIGGSNFNVIDTTLRDAPHVIWICDRRCEVYRRVSSSTRSSITVLRHFIEPVEHLFGCAIEFYLLIAILHLGTLICYLGKGIVDILRFIITFDRIRFG